MFTVYHRLDSPRGSVPEASALGPRDLELVAVVPHADGLAEAFDHVIHRDGENWTDDPAVIVVGSPRGKRSTHEGDVLVASSGQAYLVLPLGFQCLPTLALPYLPG